MSISNSSQKSNQPSKNQRTFILLLVAIFVFILQFLLFYLFQIIFPYISFLGLASFAMAILVAFSKENTLQPKIVEYSPREINMQIILTSMFFLVTGFIMLYISQFLNGWNFTNLNGTGNISIYEISLISIFVSLCMVVFFSIKHFFIKNK